MGPAKQAVSMTRMIGVRDVYPPGGKNARESLFYTHIGPKLKAGCWTPETMGGAAYGGDGWREVQQHLRQRFMN